MSKDLKYFSIIPDWSLEKAYNNKNIKNIKYSCFYIEQKILSKTIGLAISPQNFMLIMLQPSRW